MSPTPHPLRFSHITIPISILDQALNRIHAGGWTLEAIIKAEADVLIVASARTEQASLRELVWAGEERKI